MPPQRARKEVARRSYAETDLVDSIVEVVSDRIVRKGIGRTEFERSYGREQRVYKAAKYKEATALSLTSWMNLAEAMGLWSEALDRYMSARARA